MDLLTKITQLIFDAIDDLNDQLPEGRRVETTPDAMLYAKHGKLDSLRLVSLVVEVEQRIEDEFGISITLADEKAVSQTESPFTTVASFANYIARRLEDSGRFDRGDDPTPRQLL